MKFKNFKTTKLNTKQLNKVKGGAIGDFNSSRSNRRSPATSGQ